MEEPAGSWRSGSEGRHVLEARSEERLGLERPVETATARLAGHRPGGQASNPRASLAAGSPESDPGGPLPAELSRWGHRVRGTLTRQPAPGSRGTVPCDSRASGTGMEATGIAPGCLIRQTPDPVAPGPLEPVPPVVPVPPVSRDRGPRSPQVPGPMSRDQLLAAARLAEVSTLSDDDDYIAIPGMCTSDDSDEEGPGVPAGVLIQDTRAVHVPYVHTNSTGAVLASDLPEDALGVARARGASRDCENGAGAALCRSGTEADGGGTLMSGGTGAAPGGRTLRPLPGSLGLDDDEWLFGLAVGGGISSARSCLNRTRVQTASVENCAELPEEDTPAEG